MKSVLISIRPKWCEKICHKIGKDENGKPIYEKRIEVRKSAPKEVPFKAYIYATRPKKFYKCGAMSTSDELLWLANGKVEMGDGFKFWADGDEYQCLNGRIIGEFICDKIRTYIPLGLRGFEEVSDNILAKMCLSKTELDNYGGLKTLYGWHISDLKIYDKPRGLSEFNRPCSYAGLCYSCDRAKFTSKGDRVCEALIPRPPQSYMFVEELK